MSPEGQPIEVWTLTSADDGASPSDLPAVAIIAGVQGHHQIGPITADAMLRLLADEHAESLVGRTVYIIPRLNPDGLARFRSERSARALSGRAPEQRDADGDRRTDEDPPNDLNGDGYITMMRVPAPNTAYGIEATHVISEADPRLLVAPEKNEPATHALMIEGVDDDGDGRFNEDGWGGAAGGGTDLDMHFPAHWPEHTDGAGRYPLERPEARAVVEWLQSRPNVSAVVIWGPHDTIVQPPPTKKYGPTGRVPTGIEEGDAPAYALVSEAYKQLTGITGTEPGPDRAGSLVQWCYADLGVYAWSTPVWVRPDLVREQDDPEQPETQDEGAEAPTAEQIEAADRNDLAERGVGQMFIDFLYMSAAQRSAVLADVESMSEAELSQLMSELEALPADVRSRVTAVQTGGEDPGPAEDLIRSISGDAPNAKPASNSSAASGNSAEAKWLTWLDGTAEGGFIDWTPYDHPQLGAVEIGGFVPGVRVNPPERLQEALAGQHAGFVAELLGMLPELVFDEPTIEPVGAGLWRVGITLKNNGTLPTKSAMGVKARRLPGIVCVLDPEQRLSQTQILSGGRSIRFDSIDGQGAFEQAEWLVQSAPGERVAVEIRTSMFGTTRFELTLEAAQ